MKPDLAAETLEKIDGVRRQTRADLRAFWFPLVVFGSLTLGSAAVVPAAGGDAVGLYWAIAGPAGGVATGWYYYRHQQRTGVEGPAAPYVATGLAILVGALLAGGLGSASASELAAAVGPTMVVSAGYFVFARLERSVVLAALAAGLGALAVAVGLSGMDGEPATVVLALCSGAASLLIGLFYRLGAGS